MEVDIVAGRARCVYIVADSVVADSVVADAIVADLDHSDGNHSNRVLTGVIANPVKSKTNQDRSLLTLPTPHSIARARRIPYVHIQASVLICFAFYWFGDYSR